MSEDRLDGQAKVLLRLSEDVRRIAGALAEISIGFAAGSHSPADNLNVPEIGLDTVQWLIKARRHRTRYLSPELFAEPAWDMLLDLLHAELAGRRVSVSSASIASGTPPTTGLRWLKVLEQQNLVVRKCDEHDGRRAFVELAAPASRALRLYFHEVIEARQAGQP